MAKNIKANLPRKSIEENVTNDDSIDEHKEIEIDTVEEPEYDYVEVG